MYGDQYAPHLPAYDEDVESDLPFMLLDDMDISESARYIAVYDMPHSKTEVTAQLLLGMMTQNMNANFEDV